jgi:hypothetical protein
MDKIELSYVELSLITSALREYEQGLVKFKNKMSSLEGWDRVYSREIEDLQSLIIRFEKELNSESKQDE